MSYKKLVFSAVVAVITLASSWSYAAPLNLDLTEFDPDLSFNFGSATYDAATDIFSLEAYTATLSSDGETSQDVFGSVSLTAEISAGGILVDGTISVLGTTSGDIINASSGTLLTGTLTAFGFSNDAQEILEFIFTPTGGDLAPLYVGYDQTPAGVAGVGGLILSATGYDDNDFNSNFSGTAFGTFGDLAPIPVPAALWLFGSALMGMVWLARVKRA
jgi:hypothetical protein